MYIHININICAISISVYIYQNSLLRVCPQSFSQNRISHDLWVDHDDVVGFAIFVEINGCRLEKVRSVVEVFMASKVWRFPQMGGTPNSSEFYHIYISLETYGDLGIPYQHTSILKGLNPQKWIKMIGRSKSETSNPWLIHEQPPSKW